MCALGIPVPLYGANMAYGIVAVRESGLIAERRWMRRFTSPTARS